MNHANAIRLLTAIRTEARKLAAREHILGDDFHAWHRQALKTLAEIYGHASPELVEFTEIRYELDPTALDSFRRTLRSIAEDHGVDLTKERIDLSSSQTRRYYQGLAEAEGLLTTLILRRQ